MDKSSEFQSNGCEFDSWQGCYQVTTLGKLLTTKQRNLIPAKRQ